MQGLEDVLHTIHSTHRKAHIKNTYIMYAQFGPQGSKMLRKYDQEMNNSIRLNPYGKIASVLWEGDWALSGI